MATTKKQLAEQIIRILNSGDTTNDNSIDPRELLLAIEQERDRLVRIRLFESLQMGEMIVAGDVISSFDNVLPVGIDIESGINTYWGVPSIFHLKIKPPSY